MKARARFFSILKFVCCLVLAVGVGRLAFASAVCPNGKPMEFKATYLCAQYHGNAMLKFNWLQPFNQAIGKGFTIMPDLKPGWNSSFPCDLDFIVTGPGLPANGQRVVYQWANNQCFGVQTVTSVQGSIEYTVELYGGTTNQPLQDGTNTATWTLCYDGPFEAVKMKSVDLGFLWSLSLWDMILNIRKCGNEFPCLSTSEEGARKAQEAIDQLQRLQVPEDRMRLQRQVIEKLLEFKTKLEQSGRMVTESVRLRDERARLELREQAIKEIELSQRLRDEANELFRRLFDIDERESRRFK